MANAPVTRKLAAILSADVRGYSRLMGENEVATIRTLTAYREVMTRLIQDHHGRVVDSPGDNLLAEFASAVDAIQGAVAIQQELKTKNADLPPHRQMHYRIGINVGDVVVEGERIYGDGVNIAARLESLAEGGGICVAANVYEQVKNKLALDYAYQGEQTVKNITEPVRVYSVRLADENALPAASIQSSPRGWSSRVYVIGTVLVLFGVGSVVWQQVMRPGGTPVLTSEIEGLPLPDKPSIAVLPFTNMSNDPEQAYFSDGMTEDIITDLSKISGLFVIARHSTFAYKGQTVDGAEVGRKLGVRYVLEGSVRKVDERVRINAQLIDTTTGAHEWAERYDREMDDLFALQDEITQEIIRALRVEVEEAERKRVRRVPTDNLTAYDAWLRGVEYYWRVTQDDNVQARQLFERAIELDPQYADAYASLGWTYWLEWLTWNQDPQLLDRAGELAQQALALDDSLPVAHGVLGYVYLWRKQPEQAIAECERAIALDPNRPDAHVWLAEILIWAGRPAEAVGLVQQAMRLNPRYPVRYPHILGMAYHHAGQYDDAIAALQEVLRRNPNYLFAYTWLAYSYLYQWVAQWNQDPQTLERAEEAGQQLIALSDSTYWAHGALSQVHLWQKRYEEARRGAERAVVLNATDALSHTYLGQVLNFVGRPEEALARMEQVSCSTTLGDPAFCFSVLADAQYLTGRYEEAIADYRQALTQNPQFQQRLRVHLGLAASYSELGREEEARAEIATVVKMNPQFSLERMRQVWPYKDPADLERFATALRQAGLE